MIYYYLVLFLVVLWIYLEYNALHRKAIVIPTILLSFFAGIRHFSVGSDTKAYVSSFIYNYTPVLDSDSSREFGYRFFEYIILKQSYNYFWLLFISALIIVICYLTFFKKYSNNYLLSVFIFITFNLYTFFFNGLRQGIAIAISVWSLKYIIERNFIKFACLILFASFFHQSVLILILFYFILNLSFKLEYKIISVFLGSLILSGIIINYLALSNERYSSYAEESSKSGGYLTLILYGFIGLVTYLYYKKNIFSNYYIVKINEFFLCGIAFIIPVAFLGASASGPQRLIYYFCWCVCLLIPYTLSVLKNELIYLFFIIFCLLYFYLFTSQYAKLTPYLINDSLRFF